MENKLEIVFNYDFDPERGYTKKSIILDRNEWAIYEDILRNQRKVIVHLYPEDIAKLLEGTGVDLDEI
jgi:hypothetical protein